MKSFGGNRYEEIWKLLNENSIQTSSNPPTNLLCVLCNKLIVDCEQTPCGCRFCSKCIISYFGGKDKPCPGKSEECIEDNLILKKDVRKDNNANREISKLTAKCPFQCCTTENELRFLNDHVSNCGYKPINCENCNKTLIKKDIKEHNARDCDFRIVDCQFCNENFSYKILIDQHHNVQHDLLCEKYKSKCPNRCGEKRDVSVKQHLRVCTNKPEPCPYKILGCDLNNIPKDSINGHLNSMNYNHSKMLLSQFENLNNEISALKLDKELKDKEIQELKRQIKLQENLYEKKHNDFIWKVENFSTLRNQAVNKKIQYVTSKAFLTDRYGYKVCMKLFPNGYSDAAGQFLSVFFVVSKGKYDELLPWPFKSNVHFTLLNFKEGANHTRSIINETNSSEFGICRFIEQYKVVEDSYLSDSDAIYIKCCVD